VSLAEKLISHLKVVFFFFSCLSQDTTFHTFSTFGLEKTKLKEYLQRVSDANQVTKYEKTVV